MSSHPASAQQGGADRTVTRFLATALVMGAISCRDLVAASPRDLLVSAVSGVILFSIFVAETHGVALTSATNTALIISLYTIFTPFLDFGIKGRLPPAGVIGGALVAIAGVGILAGGVSVLSMSLVLTAAVMRAVMVVSVKRLMSDRHLSSAAVTAVQAFTVTGL